MIRWLAQFLNLREIKFLFRYTEQYLSNSFTTDSTVPVIRLSVSGNRHKFTFDDLLPNMVLLNRRNPNKYFQYAPFDTIVRAAKDTIVNANTNFILDLKIDGALTTNVYTWLKNGAPL